MHSPSLGEESTVVPEFLAGGGEMGQRIREYPWEKTPLGPVATWPQSLRTCIRIMLTSRQPIWIGWGKELIKFYNDPYLAIVGGKHPWALGKPAAVVWKDIWRDIEPMLKQVMEKDQGTYVESQLLIMERNGYPEETYYTFSYTPIPGADGKTAGMFCANTDDTGKIISERQLKTLTQLGKRLVDSQSADEVIERTIATLNENPHDFPFAFFRRIQNGKAVLAQSTPLGEAKNIIPEEVNLNSDHPIAKVLSKAIETGKMQLFDHLISQVGLLPKGVWEAPTDQALVIPIIGSGLKEPYGILVVGKNPYRLLNEKYSGFFSLIADQIATAFSDVYLLEEERKRATALAEIDRAKTTFFSNISHEFRTPLTLLLGPLEEIVNDPFTHATNKGRADIAYRNALRMQRLVNTLLEFSRIEAGRVEGKFSQVDIGAFTLELASIFRSAVEKAGMQLNFFCSAVNSEVYVDTDMWERIVLNLVSNAFKYTKRGTIDIRIQEKNGSIEFSVSDTGVGIPKEHLDKIFDRFHRIENIQGRSQEGTGIGLALVKELVKLHGGTITVASTPAKGSTFTVAIPTGKEHLPVDKIVQPSAALSVSTTSVAFVQEAMRWIPDLQIPSIEKKKEIAAGERQPRINQGTGKYKVLLADDNADMRDYVARILSQQFEVLTSVDGEDAFEKLQRFRPDLLLSDIMMPRLDGFGLIKKVRNHPDTKTLPVIFLSAKAGEEAKVEGWAAGADDYLVKPFSARELLAKVDANIKIAKSRIAAENILRNVISQAPVAMAILRGPSFVIEIANERALEIWGRTHAEIINKTVKEALPEVEAQGFVQLLKSVYETGMSYRGDETQILLNRYGKTEMRYLNFIYEPLRNEQNEITGIIAVGVDVTEQVMARKKVEQSEKELNELANAVPQLVWVADPTGQVTYYNNRVYEFRGSEKNENGTWKWKGLVHPDDAAATEQAWQKAVQTGTVYQVEHRIQMKDGTFCWHLSRGVPYKDEDGKIVKWFGSATDIHASKEQKTILEEEVKKRTAELNELNVSLQQSNNELQQFAHVASHDLQEPLRKIMIFNNMIKERFEVSPEVQLYINKSTDSAERMKGLIRSLLDYSRLTSGVRYEKVALNEILKNVVVDYEVLIEQKGATVQSSDLATIDGIPLQLNQLFYNLVGNALKFTQKDKPPVLTISGEYLAKEEAEMYPQLNPSVEYYKLNFRDNGIGFSQEYANKIFTIFQQLNARTLYDGYGIGLALCRKIVENHKGIIVANGELNAGATFTVILPVNR